jgi:hypothetical protein
MFEQFATLHPVLQALLATCFTWMMTTLGAAVVFWRREMPRKVLDWMLGCAAAPFQQSKCRRILCAGSPTGRLVPVFFVDWREPFPVPCDESKHHRRGRNIKWHR